MKSTHRQTAAAVGLFALSLVGAPVFAQRPVQAEQRGGPPKPDTYFILVTTFQSPDRPLGVLAGDEVRKRLQSEYSMKDLAVVTKTSINSTLEASGYRPDSALNASDLMELSKQLHGEYVIDGKASKNGSAVRLETRILMRTGMNTVAQPLPTVEGKDAGDAAKAVEKALAEALKGMPLYRKCIADLRAAKNDDAIVSARAGITAYPNSALSRICLLNAYLNKKEGPDSIISVANQLRSLDPSNLFALGNLAEAYKAKGDKDKAIEINMVIYRVDPSNTAVVRGIIDDLANSGAPDKALPLLDSLIVGNPGDAGMIRTKWLLQLKAGKFKDAIATGEELIKLDTASATLDFYNRQIGAAQSDSNPAKIIELAAKAGQKFPKDASFPQIMAQSYRKTGQLQQALAAARRATEIDPKDTRSWLMGILTANDMNQPDTASAIAAKAIAAGADKAQISASLLTSVGAAVRKAQASKTRADWDEALKAAEAVDAISSSPETQYFIGVSSFSVAADMATEIQTLVKGTPKAPEKAQACTLAKQAEDYFAKTSISMPKGGRVDAATAGQILGAVGQYGPFLAEVKKQFCK